MIRFSAFLVAVALGLLVAGVVTSKLMLVYVAIGVSGVALLALGAGALIKRNELFGQSKPAGANLARPAQAGAYVPPGQPQPQVAPWEAPVAAGSAWPAAAQPAPSRPGYLPAEQPLPAQPVKAQPADAAATAWGSGFPFPPEPPTRAPARAPAGRPAPPGRVHAPAARTAAGRTAAGRAAVAARPGGSGPRSGRLGVARGCSRHPAPPRDTPSRAPAPPFPRPPFPRPPSPLKLPSPPPPPPSRPPPARQPAPPSPPKASPPKASPPRRTCCQRCVSSQPYHPPKTSGPLEIGPPLKTRQGSRTRTSSPPATT